MNREVRKGNGEERVIFCALISQETEVRQSAAEAQPSPEKRVVDFNSKAG